MSSKAKASGLWASDDGDDSANLGPSTRGKTRNYPNLTLQQALVVARTIQDKASGIAVSRLTLADLMGNSPESSTFRNLLQASRAYGLTTGGVNAPNFELTSLGDTATGADEVAQQQAQRQLVLSVGPYREFLTSFNGKKIPAPNVSREFLVKKCKVPEERTEECLRFMLTDARLVGFIRTLQGSEYIDLAGTPPPASAPVTDLDDSEDGDNDAIVLANVPAVTDETANQTVERHHAPSEVVPVQAPLQPKKVFIAHGKDRGPLEHVKKMLDVLKVKYAVAVDEPNKGRPVSAKVAALMRDECSSAIFIFTADEHFQQEDEHGNKIDVWRPSENAVYELGAASILYDKRIVIFKEKRVTLASNFSDLGYIPFEVGGIEMQMGQLFQELVALDILEVRAKG